MKLPDVLIICFSLALVIFLSHSAYVKNTGTKTVLIRGQNDEWTYSIDADETVRVKGPAGITVIRIHENRAWVESSPCENQNCVAAGHISRQGQWAACLPNNVLVMITGNGDDDVDAVVW